MMPSNPAVAAEESTDLAMVIRSVEAAGPRAGYRPVRLITSRGKLMCRYYPVPNVTRAILWVGGAAGGWDSPARNAYPCLCREFREQGIASLRVRFRCPANLEESVLDVLAGIAYLESAGAQSLALVGHSFGAAVAIQAVAISPAVQALVALAAQGYGSHPISRLGPHCATLLIHGRADEILPAVCSEQLYQLAQDPKRLVLYHGAGHVLYEVADKVRDQVRGWILTHLDGMAA